MQKLIERWMQTCAHIGLLAGGLALTSTCWAVEVSSNDAVRAVGNWLSRSGVRHDYRIGGVRTFAESGGRGRFHVVDLKKGGFVITSGDTKIRPILAESDEGSFSGDPASPLYSILMMDTGDDPLTNSLVNGSVKLRSNAVVARSSAMTQEESEWDKLLNGISAGSPTVQKSFAASAAVQTMKNSAPVVAKDYSQVLVDSFIDTRWNQATHNNYHEVGWVFPIPPGKTGGNLCYNRYTPPIDDEYGTRIGHDGKVRDTAEDESYDAKYLHTSRAVCGCVATAGAQLMKFHKWPKRFDFGAMTLRPSNAGGRSCYEAIGDLTYKIGKACNASWQKRAGDGGTSMHTSRLVSELRNEFNYAAACYDSPSCSSVDDNGVSEFGHSVYPNLLAKKPVILDITKTSIGGHCVLADGLAVSGGKFKIHVNMGWGGQDDSWYFPPQVQDYKRIRGVGVNIDPSKRTALIGGMVVDDDGSPLKGMKVYLKKGSSVSKSATTNSRGTFVFEAADGTWTVLAEDPERPLSFSASMTTSVSYGDSSTKNAFLILRLSLPEQVPPPVLNIDNTTPGKVRISANQSDYDLSYGKGKVEIRLTTDGSLPDASSPLCSDSYVYSGTGSITVRARAFCSGYKPSFVREEVVDVKVPDDCGSFSSAFDVNAAHADMTFDNAKASREPGEPVHSTLGNAGGASVWVKFTATESGDYTFTASGSSPSGIPLDTQLAVYGKSAPVRAPARANGALMAANGPGVDFASLSRVAANDDANAGEYDYSSRVAFSAVAGESYYVAVDTAGGEKGILHLAWKPERNDVAEPMQSLVYCNPGAETHAVTIRSTANWEAVSVPEWVTVTKSSGADGEAVTFEVPPLEGEGSRSGTILVAAGEGYNSAIHVVQSTGAWFRSRDEALAAAAEQGKRVLMVCGRDSCDNTTYVRLTACEAPAVRTLLAEGYVLWYADVDKDISEYGDYEDGLYYYSLPLVCIIDPDHPSTYVARTTDFMTADELQAFLLDHAEPATPTAVSGLRAPSTEACSGVVALEWNRARRASSYEIWRGTSWDPATAVRIASGEVVEEFVDEDVEPDVVYWYRVRAVNAAGEGAFSVPCCGCAKSRAAVGDPALADAVGAPQLPWVTDPDARWSVAEDEAYDGVAALRSGQLDYGGSTLESVLRTAVSGPTLMSFEYKALLWYAAFVVEIDGEEAFRTTEDALGWTRGCVAIPEGDHDVTFRCLKRMTDSTFYYQSPAEVVLDAVWFDAVSETPAFATPTSMSPWYAHCFCRTFDVGFEIPAGGTIHYTTDGSVPTVSSPAYTGSLVLEKTTHVRAVCVQPGRDVSQEIPGLYLERHSVVPGEWTTDVDGVREAGLTGGNLIVVMRSDFTTCYWSQQLRPVVESPEFLSWARQNGVYLVRCDMSQDVDYSPVSSWSFTLHNSAGYTSGVMATPTFGLASPWSPDKALASVAVYDGKPLGDILYDGSVKSLTDALARFFRERPQDVRVKVEFNGNQSRYMYTYTQEEVERKAGAALGPLPVPTLQPRNCVFAGWWTDSKNEFNNGRVSAETVVPYQDVTYYAHWREIPVLKPGTVCLAEPYPLEAKAGTTVRFRFSRINGCDGSIAVKVKTQTSTALIGTGPENGDLLYVKEVLEWADGDTSDKYIDVPIYTTGVGRQFRFKLATMATGTYEGNLVPQLEQTKIYVPIVGATPGMIALAPTLFSLTAFENTTCRVWFSRIGGSDGSIAVKVKSQTSTATLRSDPTPWGQVGYVKKILEWGPGDTSDRYVDVPIYSNGAGLMFRLKLSTLATGVYQGNLVPKLEEAKIYVPIVK